MDQLNDKLSEIELLLSQLSDVRLSIAESIGEDPNNIDGMINALLNAQKCDSNNNNGYSNSTQNKDYKDKNKYNDCYNNNVYKDTSNNSAVGSRSSPTETESSRGESTDEMIENLVPPQYVSDNYIKIDSSSNNKQPYCNGTNNQRSVNSKNNAHFDGVSVVSNTNCHDDADLDYIISEQNDIKITNGELEPYDSVSDGNTNGHLYSATSDTYVMSDDEPNTNKDAREKMPSQSGDQVFSESFVSEPIEETCCTSYGARCRDCVLRVSTCLWFLVSSLLFVLDIYSDLCLAIHYTVKLHQVWASLTFIFFFLPWMYNVYSFYKFQRCKRNVWERWSACFFLLLGLYPVFRSLVAFLDNLYARQHNNQKRRNASDPDNNSTSAAEIFMMTVLLQDIPQLFLQVFIVGRRDMMDAPAMFSIVTSFLCIVITVSSGFVAITQGQYEWMNGNVEMFLLQPSQEKILQSRILKDEWKDFYENSPTFDPLLVEVEKSKEKLKAKMAAVMTSTKPTSLLRKGKYYASTLPIYILMTLSFVPGLSLFASLEEVKFSWMWLVVYFMVHLYVTWSWLCCRGTIYFPIQKLRRPLINYTTFKCSCRTCAMRFSFVLQIVFFLLANSFVSVWCSSMAHFVTKITNSSTPQCLPSYIWPNTLPVLKTVQVELINNNTTTDTDWLTCQTNYASSKRYKNIYDSFIDWILTFKVCISDHVTVVYWLVTVSSALLLVYHFLLVCQPRVEVSLNHQTKLWREIFDERKNLWDKIGEEQKTIKAWDRAKASKTIQRNEVWCTTVNKFVYNNWKKKSTPV